LAANDIFRLHADLLAFLKPLSLFRMSKDRALRTAYLLSNLPQWYAGPVINLLGSVPINHAAIV
jgi:hypothetical protein